jgi:hypothetical protein
MTKPKKSLEKVRDQISLSPYSRRKEESYINWIKEYIYCFDNLDYNISTSEILPSMQRD